MRIPATPLSSRGILQAVTEDMTSGQRWTAGLGLAAAVLTMAIGIPPVLRSHGHPALLSSSAPTASRSSSSTSMAPARSSALATSPPAASPFTGQDEAVPGPAGVAAISTPSAHGAPFGPDLSGARSGPAPAGTVPVVSASPGATEPGRPLHVTGGGWAGSAGGTPAGSAGLASGDLPVAWWGGPQKAAFLRLAGRGDTLVLKVDTQQAATYLDTSAVIWMCPIATTTWNVAPDSGSSSAPAFTCSLHAVGRRSPDGSQWTFDLSRFEARAMADGVTLQPEAPPGVPAYQVAFLGP